MYCDSGLVLVFHPRADLLWREGKWKMGGEEYFFPGRMLESAAYGQLLRAVLVSTQARRAGQGRQDDKQCSTSHHHRSVVAPHHAEALCCACAHGAMVAQYGQTHTSKRQCTDRDQAVEKSVSIVQQILTLTHRHALAPHAPHMHHMHDSRPSQTNEPCPHCPGHACRLMLQRTLWLRESEVVVFIDTCLQAPPLPCAQPSRGLLLHTHTLVSVRVSVHAFIVVHSMVATAHWDDLPTPPPALGVAQ